MLQKFKVTTFAFILCLVGLALISVSPIFAAYSAAFVECQKIKPHGKFRPMEQKKNCFRDRARLLQPVSTQNAPPPHLKPPKHAPVIDTLGYRSTKRSTVCNDVVGYLDPAYGLRERH